MASLLPPGVNGALIPAGIPPAGVQSNLVDPYTLQPATLGVGAVLIVLATSLVAISILEHSKKPRLADYCSVFALAVSVAYSAVVFAISYSARHMWDLPVSFMTPWWEQIVFSLPLLQMFSLFFSKLAIFLFYLHIFNSDRATKIAIYLGIFFSLLIYAPTEFLFPILCTPRAEETWLTVFLTSRCYRTSVIWGVIQAVLEVLLDFYIFVIPIPLLSGLRLERKKKLGLLIVFGTALLGIAASVITLAFRILLLNSKDQTFVAGQNYICVMVEAFTAIVVANLVPSAAYFRRYFRARPTGPSYPTRSQPPMGSDRPSKKRSNSSVTRFNTDPEMQIYVTTTRETHAEFVEDGQSMRIVEIGQMETLIDELVGSRPP